MIRNCPVTCEACKSTCKDVQSDCPGWTVDGECYKNPGFMYKECPNSCGVCDGIRCADNNATQCKIIDQQSKSIASSCAEVFDDYPVSSCWPVAFQAIRLRTKISITAWIRCSGCIDID
jgi:hypothetical protein